MECEKISVCGRQSTQPEKSKRRQSRQELSEKLDVGVPNVRGALVPNISGSMGSTAGRKASQRRKGRAAPERGSSIVLDLLLTEGGNNARGVVHEQDRSIKEDKKCGEPAGGS